MEIYQLRYFVEVAREGNFTKASERLRIAQPALSQQVKNLEEELGARLFNRGRRRSSLTSAGETLLEHALLILSAEAHARESVQEVVGLKKGRLVLATIPSISGYWLPDVVRRFRRRFPDVELNLKENSSEEVIASVAAGDAEVGLVQAPIVDAQFDSGILFEEGFELVVPTGHELEGGRLISLKQLREIPFVHYKGRAKDVVVEACRRAGFEARVACESGEIQTVLALVGAGLGVAVLPEISLGSLGRQVSRLKLKPLIRRKVLWITRKGSRSPAAEEFLALCSNP